MLKVKKVEEENKHFLLSFLKHDIIRNVFAFYDIQYEPENTIVYAAFEDKQIKGYILTYTALDFPSIVLEGEKKAAEKLVNYVAERQFIMHVPPNLLQIVKQKFPEAKIYLENWMSVKKNEAKFFKSNNVRRLSTMDDAEKLALLLSTRKERSRTTVEKCSRLISKQPIYGVFKSSELVAYAGSFIQLPQVWMIGGVYTHPEHRNKGYATLATSAVTEEALKNAEAAALFVRADNHPALRVYEKIGYKKIDERLWVDVRTGLKP